MLLFSPQLGIMISDLYGIPGGKELTSMAKKMRLGKDQLRNAGHPVDEHYIVPAAKHDGVAARGIEVLGAVAFSGRRGLKKPVVETVKEAAGTC